jgi:hypothetical protein
MGDGSLPENAHGYEKQPVRVKSGFRFAPYLYVAGSSAQNGVAGRHTCRLSVGRTEGGQQCQAE